MKPTYALVCQKCATEYPGGDYRLTCDQCGKSSLLRTKYPENIRFESKLEDFFAFKEWLPYRNELDFRTFPINCVQFPELNEELNTPKLWVALSGYSPENGSEIITGTFKECEAIGVLNRVREETDKVLVISSAGNAGRAFLEYGQRYELPMIIVVPEKAKDKLWVTSESQSAKGPLLLYVEEGYYPEAIKTVDYIIDWFPDKLVREGGVYNVGRRDSMGIPFLRAVNKIGYLPENYLQSVGSGTGAIAAWDIAQRLIDGGFVKPEKPMKLHLVQNLPFTPMVDAWKAGSRTVAPMAPEEVSEKLQTVYAAVLSNANPPYGTTGGIFDILSASDGEMYGVTNEEAIAAQEFIFSKTGYEPCNASAVTAAGLLKGLKNKTINSDESILLHLTGGGLHQIKTDVGAHAYKFAKNVSLNRADEMKKIIEDYLKGFSA